MTREVVKWLESLKKEIGKAENYTLWHYAESIDLAIEALKAQEWVPVSERLPKKYAQYLVCFKTGHRYVYWLEDSDWARYMVEKEGIIAWMPLPEPYREDSEA